jgi:tRNA threonylcarbamoyladenosine biosynthesis protein TsaB
MRLLLRTDGAVTHIGVRADTETAWTEWESGRQLAQELLSEISRALQAQGATIHDVRGIVVFRGPGSFTSLRIGVTTANSLAYSLGAPIVGSGGDRWADDGLARLDAGKNEFVMPAYGAAPNITAPRH